MLIRRLAANKVVYYASPLIEALGVPHAFSTRIGGVSAAPFGSLNLGNPSGCAEQDESGRIEENYHRLQAAAGLAGRERCAVHQVHGGTVIPIHPGQPFERGMKADAMVSDDPGRVLSIRIADCVPVLLTSDDGRTVAAIHAGWRGVIARVVPAALEALQRQSASRHGALPSITAAIGPSIGFDAFEVGAEVLEQFEQAFGAAAPIRRRDDGKGHVDLRAAIAMQLCDAGIAPERIDTTDRCTFAAPGEFFSHRRDHGVTGRMAALIAPRAPAGIA